MRTLIILAACLLAACTGGDNDESVPWATTSGTSAEVVQPANVAARSSPDDPPYSWSEEALQAGLDCPPFQYSDTDPILLVHGTFTYGDQNYGPFLAPVLREHGRDVCLVTYPDRGLLDMQRTAEFVAHAVQRMAAETGRKVVLVGHSQGVMQIRWAVKWWPSVRAQVSDLISLAGPNQGILLPTVPRDLLALMGINTAPFPGSFYQFAQNSNFLRALNADDETPGDIDYTVLYTQFDELIQPVAPFPAGALEFGQENPKRTNVLLQDVCPGRLVEHGLIGFTDSLAIALLKDAIDHDGPADVARAGGASLCEPLPLLPGFMVSQTLFSRLLADMLLSEFEVPQRTLGLSAGEPPLMPYAR